MLYRWNVLKWLLCEFDISNLNLQIIARNMNFLMCFKIPRYGLYIRVTVGHIKYTSKLYTNNQNQNENRLRYPCLGEGVVGPLLTLSEWLREWLVKIWSIREGLRVWFGGVFSKLCYDWTELNSSKISRTEPNWVKLTGIVTTTKWPLTKSILLFLPVSKYV